MESKYAHTHLYTHKPKLKKKNNTQRQPLTSSKCSPSHCTSFTTSFSSGNVPLQAVFHTLLSHFFICSQLGPVFFPCQILGQSQKTPKQGLHGINVILNYLYKVLKSRLNLSKSIYIKEKHAVSGLQDLLIVRVTRRLWDGCIIS